MDTKECNKCQKEKPLTDYGKDKKNKDKLKSVCKICLSEYKKQYILLNKEKINDYNKLYRQENKDKIKEYEKQRFQEKKSEISAKNKIYKIKHKERDRDKNNLQRLKYKKNRCLIDPLYKLKINIRSLIANSIKNRGYHKNSKTQDILGCTPEFFKEYIESLWLHPKNLDENGNVWMSWNNHGLYNGTLNHGWDMDHIIPITSSLNEDDVIKLNHYTNIQPLCSKVNRYIKRNKI